MFSYLRSAERYERRLRIKKWGEARVCGTTRKKDARGGAGISSLAIAILEDQRMAFGTRRDFLQIAGMSATGVRLGLKRQSPAGDGVVQRILREAAGAAISVRPLRRGISVLRGAGGNIAVLSGPDGKLLVDAGLGVSRPRVSDALASINAYPIRHLINTHWHFDHTDGNEWLRAAGAGIVAHENTKKHMAQATRVDGWDYTFPAAPASALPGVVFQANYRMHLNGTTAMLKHYAPAHTDSDVSVWFPEAEVLHVGDTWWNGAYPFVDYSTGGSIDGMIRATEANLAAVTAGTAIVPGYGEVGGREDLVRFQEMLVSVRERVAGLKRTGRSLGETVAARPTAQFDAAWGGGMTSPGMFAGLVYLGV